MGPLPTAYRAWFIERINKEIDKSQEHGSDIPTKGAHHNTPDMKSLMGKFNHFNRNPRNQRPS